MTKCETYKRVIKRLLHELDQAICEDRAHAALWNHLSRGVDFWRIAFFALSNDTVAHAMKILDRHKDCVSFWYVFKLREPDICAFCARESLAFSEIEWLSDKLKPIRDRTHNHIDPRDVFDPDAVWQRDPINNARFTAILESLWKILDYLYTQEYGESFGAPDYDASDVGVILEAAKAAALG
jgi:hypothetical protein